MKNGFWFLLAGVCAAAAWAAEFEREVAEQDRDRDGLVDLRVENIVRGTSAVMSTVSVKMTNGWLTSRVYFSDSIPVLTEVDENSDGAYEFFFIRNSVSQKLEGFRRDPSGVRPASAAENERLMQLDQLKSKPQSPTVAVSPPRKTGSGAGRPLTVLGGELKKSSLIAGIALMIGGTMLLREQNQSSMVRRLAGKCMVLIGICIAIGEWMLNLVLSGN